MSRNSDNTRISRVKTRGSTFSNQLKGRDYKGKRNVASFGAHDTELHYEESVIHPQILKQARQNGHLNLSNRSMAEVPNIVWNINRITPEEGQQLSLIMDETDGQRWWDQVVLNKLILASNKLTTISSEISNLVDLTVLDVHDNQLTCLPDTLGDLLALNKLNLGHNHLETLPKNIFFLKELRSLFLQYNQIDVLDEDVGHLTLLEHLDLSYNKLKSVPYTLGYLSHLSKLNLSNNKLKSLPPEVGNMCALRCLDITHNALTKLPDEIGNLFQLEQLFVRHNQLVCLPFLKSCTSLKELQAGNNRITEVSEGLLETIKCVKILDLRDNKISTLPEKITILQELERLDLTNNSLSSIPYSIGTMPCLKSLLLEGNPMRSIRRDILQQGTVHLLRWLKSRMEDNLFTRDSDGISSDHQQLDKHALHVMHILDLSSKDLKNIPEELVKKAATEEVTSINLGKNALTDISPCLDILASKVSELNLSFNKFSSLPQIIGNFSKLVYLDLRNNQLGDLPLVLSKLSTLRELNMCNNRFEEIPTVVFTFSKLEILFASDNKITFINVSGLAKLPVLTTLDLRNNNITNVPPELGNLKQLRSLLLEGNPFRNPRPAILAKGTPALLNYLRDRIPC